MLIGKQVGLERKYSVEYVMKNYPPEVRVKFNAPLGLPAKEYTQRYPEQDIRFFKPWRKYADAIVVSPPYLDIIEAKIHDPARGFCDLMEYRELIPETPELQEFSDLTIRLIIVVPYVRPHWQRMAAKLGVNIILWRPDWMVPHLKKRGLI